MTPSCKDCPDRKILCHSTCEKYKKYREEIEYANKQRQLKNMFTENNICKRHDRKEQREKRRKGNL